MKAAVLKTFRDKHTGAVYAPGEVLTLERGRFSEIREALGGGYIAEIVDPDSTAEPEKPNNGNAPGSEGADPGALPPPAGASGGPVLAGLVVGNLSLAPEFAPNVTSYTATTTNNTNKVRAVPADGDASVLVSINGEAVPNESSVAWSNGENVLIVSVTAGDGRLTEYTVTVTKE